MNEKTRALVKQLLEEGKRYDDVRRVLISEGHDTNGFEKEYPEIQKELGIKEPPPSKLPPHASNVLNMEVLDENAERLARQKSKFISNIFKLLGGILAIVVLGVVFSGYGDTLKEKIFGVDDVDEVAGLGPTDLAHESQVKSFQLSSRAYKNKLLDYGGLCESIGIDREVYSCSEDIETFMINVPLSNGTYYCADSTGFIGAITELSGDEFACKK